MGRWGISSEFYPFRCGKHFALLPFLFGVKRPEADLRAASEGLRLKARHFVRRLEVS